MNVEGNTYLFYDKFCENHGYSNSKTINITLNDLSSSVNKIKKNVPIITCCASGMRSASAKSTLSSLGFKEVYNGGGWMSLNGKV